MITARISFAGTLKPIPIDETARSTSDRGKHSVVCRCRNEGGAPGQAVGRKEDMKGRWLKAVLALPVPVAILIPAGLLFVFRATRWAHTFPVPSGPLFWLGAMSGVLGLALALWSLLAFARFGEGTPAPWDPPARFVAKGPYCHVRNPMILGVFLVLLGEALLLRSVPLFVWFSIFVIANSLYIPFVEETSLERRFGTTYSAYRQGVSRWIPRWRAWHPSENAAPEA